MKENIKKTQPSKKEDEKFKSKHINHDPREESAREKFGLNTMNDEEIEMKGDAK